MTSKYSQRDKENGKSLPWYGVIASSQVTAIAHFGKVSIAFQQEIRSAEVTRETQ